MIRTAATTCLALAATTAGAFELQFPLDCTLGETCFIQQYADHDPGPGATDFTCGSLSYDRHDGTDFALPTLAAMQAGVAVRAAAAGVVKGMRDGMADIAADDASAPSVDGKECGNGVLIDHPEGWQTQYCHMKNGSVAVREGDTVAAGTLLGAVGLSGRTEFPHLHMTVRHNGTTVDPFEPDSMVACGGAQADTLWADPILYRAGGILDIGFATDVPEFEAIKAGLASPGALPSGAPALVLWAHVFGARAGDTLDLAITGPQAEVIRQTVTLDRTQARLFRAAGKRLPAGGWPAGRYSGEAILKRDGKELDRRSVVFRID